MPQNLFGDVVRLADQERAFRSELCVEVFPRHAPPAPLLGDTFYRLGVAEKESVGRLFPRRGDVPQRVHADLERLAGMAEPLRRFIIEVDQRSKPPCLAADDRHHEGKAKGAGARERLRRPSDSDPDWERVLYRSRKYPLAA